MRFPTLSRIKLLGADTETSGLGPTAVPVGFSFHDESKREAYIRWGHEGGENNCTLEQFRNWANKELNRDGLTLAWHNANFDLKMLSRVGVNLTRARHEDTCFIYALLNELEGDFTLEHLAETKIGQRKLDEELNQFCADAFGGKPTRYAQAGNYWRAPGDIVEEYAISDARNTFDLYKFGRPQIDTEELGRVYELETALIPILLKMHQIGVKINLGYAQKLKRDLVGKRDEEWAKWLRITGGRSIGHKSGKQLAALFDELGLKYSRNEPTEKMIEKAQGKGEEPIGNPCFDKEFLGHYDHPAAQTILKLRQLDHFVGTFIDSYVLSNVDSKGFIHGDFHPLKNEDYGTVSGRFSSGGGLNLQNIPARDEEIAPMIRGMYVPWRKDCDWLKIDYSQIEYRFLAHYAGGMLAERYNEDPDVDFHVMCSEIVGIPRRPAKNINFGIVYGMGEDKMARQLGVPLDEARDMLSEYHHRLPLVKAFYKKVDRRAQRRGFIITYGGRKRRFRTKAGKRIATHKALNALLQGSAADLIKMAMVRVANEVIDWEESPLHLTVHDELDFSIPKGARGVQIKNRIVEAMQDFQLNVPVKADASIGPDWGHVE